MNALDLKFIKQRIYLIGHKKVMLSADLAAMYGVEPRVLIQAVKRNIERFPEDFMIQLTLAKTRSLRSQFVILDGRRPLKPKRGRHTKYAPYAFTEQGIAMLSSVLKSRRAVQVNIAVMRAFVRVREMAAERGELASKLKELERTVSVHDENIQSLFAAIHRLMEPMEKPKSRIGFMTNPKLNASSTP